MKREELKKDLMTIYMFKNAFTTFVIALVAFMISLTYFYQCTLIQSLQRIFFYDIYTTLYFLLVWLFNYLLFETSKILYDLYESKITFIPCIILIVLCIVIFMLPILDMLQYNLCFLFILICLRMVRQMWKNTPELFVWVHKIKRPKDGLK